MKETGSVNVHHVTIVRSAQTGGVVNIAKCRLCGIVIERCAGPLTIKTPGLYADHSGGTQDLPSWSAVELFQPGMQACMTKA